MRLLNNKVILLQLLLISTIAVNAQARCLALKDVLNKINLEHRYSPLGEISAIEVEELRRIELAALNEAKSFGVRLKLVDDPTGLEAKIAQGEVPDVIPDLRGARYYGRMYEIESLGSVGRKHWNTLAIQHPDFRSEVERIRKGGGRVVFDPTLDAIHSDAFYRKQIKVVGIGPNTSWYEFIHELQHLDFDQSIRPALRDLKVIFKNEKAIVSVLPMEAMKDVGVDKIKRIESLFRKGIMSENSIDEILAVDAHLRAMGWARYSPAGSEGRGYALKHIITDLEKLGPERTPQQNKLLKRSKLKYELLNLDTKEMRVKVGKALGGVTGVGAVGYGAYAALGSDGFEEHFAQYRTILYDKAGHLIGIRPDDSVDFMTLRKSH